MPRIQAIQPNEIDARTQPLLDQVQRSLGLVPNMMKTMARSRATLSGYLELNRALSGALDAKLREQIALAVAGANGCSYCASAHTALGSLAGLTPDELESSLQGRSEDPRTEAALRFARRVLETRGDIEDADLAAVYAAGFGVSEAVEIVAHVALNVFTNYLNNVADTAIDFPVVQARPRAA